MEHWRVADVRTVLSRQHSVGQLRLLDHWRHEIFRRADRPIERVPINTRLDLLIRLQLLLLNLESIDAAKLHVDIIQHRVDHALVGLGCLLVCQDPLEAALSEQLNFPASRLHF